MTHCCVIFGQRFICLMRHAQQKFLKDLLCPQQEIHYLITFFPSALSSQHLSFLIMSYLSSG